METKLSSIFVRFTVKLLCEATDRVSVSSLQDRVPSQLTHITAREFPHLGGNAVLLHQRLLGEVELEGVVGGDGDVEASGKVVRQGGAVVGQEEGVVAERAHGDAHLDGGTFINASELNQLRQCHLICTRTPV